MKIIILGATTYGMEKAVSLAQLGHDVLLTTSASYPGEDLFGSFRAYFDPSALSWIRAFTGKKDFSSPAAMKAALLQTLLSAGIKISYYTRAAAALLNRNAVCGMLLAGPNGLFSRPCDLVIDATLLQSPTHQAAGAALILPSGARLPLRVSVIAPSQPAIDMLTAQGYLADLFDPHRLHLDATCELPQPMLPSQALGFLMEQRKRRLEKIAQTAGMEAVSCDNAQPSALDIAVNAPRPAFRCWLRLEDDLVLPSEKTAYLPDSIVLNGRILPYDPQRGLEEGHRQAMPSNQKEVLICGGGTAGVWAALAAAEKGADALVIERQSALGGTRTLGGVSGLYCGNRNGLFQDLWERICAFTQNLPGGNHPAPVAESLFYHHAAAESRLQIRLNAQLCHVFVKERRITGVMSVGDDGLHLDCAAQYIDATGEGLLCALGGCDYELGDAAAHMTQNYSQWQRRSHKSTGRTPMDQDMLMTTDDSDWMRSISNNMLRATEYDLYELLTPRETRRICGRKTITVRSIARGQRWKDTLYDAFSTFDPHGRNFSYEGRLGALPNLGKGRFSAVPLGALLPAQLDGVLVTGKALSASQEAINFLRMNADVMSIGWIAGALAAECVEKKCDADQLNLAPLQDFLFEKQAMIAPAEDTQAVSAAMLAARVLAGEDEGVINDVILARPKGMDIYLRRAATNHTYSKQFLLDVCLMLYHDPSGQDRLIEMLRSLDEKNGVIHYHDSQRASGVILGGTHGAPDDYWQMNRLMVLLAHEHCSAAIPVIASLLAHTVPGGGWINHGSRVQATRLDVNTLPNYDRILCLAHAILDMPDPVYLPELKRLTEEIIALSAPKAQIWRDYLILRLIQATAACGEKIAPLLQKAKLDDRYATIRAIINRLLENDPS